MKIAFITGGDRGIGRAISLTLAREGYHIIFTYFSKEDRAIETLNKINEIGSGEFYRMDVRNYENVREVIDRVGNKYKTIDVLVNNAGKIGRFTDMGSITLDDWKDVIETNLTGTFNCCKASLPYIKKPGGCIINISSIAGKMGGTVGVHYASSKAGVIGLTFSLASELAKYGVRVNAVAPGPVDTDLLSREIKEKLKDLAPLKRIAKPDEIAHAVRFLVENEYVTGEVVDINGGRYMD